MKDYPKFWENDHHHWSQKVSNEEALRRKNCFIKAFSPLLNHGFIKLRQGYYRMYGEEIMQMVEFSKSAHGYLPWIGIYCAPLHNQYLYCRITPEIKHFYTDCLRKSSTNTYYTLEEFSRYKYPGAETREFYRTTFFDEISDFDEALQATTELFFEQTLPIMQSIKNIRVYLDYYTKPIRSKGDYVNDYLSATWVRDWNLAEVFIDRIIRQNESAFEALKHDKLTLQYSPGLLESREKELYNVKSIREKIRARDAIWLDEYLFECIRYSHEDLNKFSANILKNAVDYIGIL